LAYCRCQLWFAGPKALWFENKPSGNLAAMTFLDILTVFFSRSGKVTDLNEFYLNTDATLARINWKKFGEEKIFETKLRFQIKVDDFRSVF
jgi:hypothetical protein